MFRPGNYPDDIGPMMDLTKNRGLEGLAKRGGTGNVRDMKGGMYPGEKAKK